MNEGIIGDTIHNLSNLIMKNLEMKAREQAHPGLDADQMDDDIRNCGKRVDELRRIRTEFEDLMSGVV